MLAVGWVLTWEWGVNLCGLSVAWAFFQHVASEQLNFSHGVSRLQWGCCSQCGGKLCFCSPFLGSQAVSLCCILLVIGNSQGYLDSKGGDIDPPPHLLMGVVSKLDRKKSTWDERYGCDYLEKCSLSQGWSWGWGDCGCSDSSECRVVVEGLKRAVSDLPKENSKTSERNLLSWVFSGNG